MLDKDVERVIKGFSSNKAPGYDRVSARVFKDCLPVFLPSTASIMDYFFHTGTFARAWKIAEFSPILSQGILNIRAIIDLFSYSLSFQRYLNDWFMDNLLVI